MTAFGGKHFAPIDWPKSNPLIHQVGDSLVTLD